MLERITLDLDSPRLVRACNSLGIDPSECELKQKQEFFPKGLDEGIAKMRYKHYQKQHLCMINRVLEERYRIKISEGGQPAWKSPKSKYQPSSRNGLNGFEPFATHEGFYPMSPIKGPHPYKLSLTRA